ncbi:MAG: hypothetical protein LBS77_00850 [Desulfovibrio sp.]|nr:hypothetical protein [Desulfovibrio sp.]
MRKKQRIKILKPIEEQKLTCVRMRGIFVIFSNQSLYQKVKHLEKCIFYTGQWEKFKNVLSSERHVVDKASHCIERDHSDTRHQSSLAGFKRRIKVVSKSCKAVEFTLRLWQVLTAPHF